MSQSLATVIEVFIQYIANSDETWLLNLGRTIDKSWKKYVDENSPQLKLRRLVARALYCDKQIYDQYSYKCDLLSAEYSAQRDNYKKLQSPFFAIYLSELDEDDELIMVEQRPLDFEVRLLIEFYIANPHKIIMLLDWRCIAEVMAAESKILTALTDNGFNFDNYVAYIPIFYVSKRKCSNIICYLSSMGNGDIFQDSNARYIMWKLDFEIDSISSPQPNYGPLVEFLAKKTKEQDVMAFCDVKNIYELLKDI